MKKTIDMSAILIDIVPVELMAIADEAIGVEVAVDVAVPDMLMLMLSSMFWLEYLCFRRCETWFGSRS